mmetsp:Transcript_1395/g.1886  ORF Transcript_1395/g.1886 Transcript_1395/m.1886 type:complete len:222 (-) Transcript_1395:79-744(-)
MAMVAILLLHALALGVTMRQTEADGAAVTYDVDECDSKKPAPQWVEFQIETYEGTNGQKFKRKVTNFIPTIGRCSDYFIFSGSDYVTMHKGADSKCMVYDQEHKTKWCLTGAHSRLVTDIMPVLCKNKLCELAKTGQWKISDNSSDSSEVAQAAKQEPWVALMVGEVSFGYEEAYNKLCWMGDAGKHRPHFDDFAVNYVPHLVTPHGFNKTTCGCASETAC